MSKRAPMDLLEVLHTATTEMLLDIIKNGVPTGERDEYGEEIRAPAPPSYVAQAVKLLKDNDITAIPTQGSPLEDLRDALPEFGEDEDPSDLPQRMN